MLGLKGHPATRMAAGILAMSRIPSPTGSRGVRESVECVVSWLVSGGPRVVCLQCFLTAVAAQCADI